MGWEVTTLAGTKTTHSLISEKNNLHIVSAELLERLTDVRERIDHASGIYTRLLICNSEETNAFAWKAGEAKMTAVTLGMIKLLGNDFDAYAALLGHENAHLVFNHLQKKSDRAIGLGALQLLAGIALEVVFQQNMGLRGLGSDLSSLGNQVVTASYSRDAEIESDKHGIKYSYRAGFDPEGALRLHRRLAMSSNFLSTHPSSEDRIRLLQEEIASIRASGSRDLAEEKKSRLHRDTARGDASEDIGQGQILTVNRRHGYFVATQTSLLAPKPGMKVFVGYAMERELSGTIQKVIDGYFSVIPDQMLAFYLEGKEFTYK
jgi:predicted Zn-dependent protease